MADILDNIYGQHKPSTGSGNFFSLEDGATARIRIQSEPYIFRAKFTKPDGTVQESNRYAWLIYNHDESKAQILKMSGTFFSSLAAVAGDPDYTPISDYDVKIKRDGTGTETKYSVTPTKTSLEMDEEALGKVAELDILADSKEDQILPLKEYLANGNKYPATPEVRDL